MKATCLRINSKLEKSTAAADMLLRHELKCVGDVSTHTKKRNYCLQFYREVFVMLNQTLTF